MNQYGSIQLLLGLHYTLITFVSFDVNFVKYKNVKVILEPTEKIKER